MVGQMSVTLDNCENLQTVFNNLLYLTDLEGAPLLTQDEARALIAPIIPPRFQELVYKRLFQQSGS